MRIQSMFWALAAVAVSGTAQAAPPKTKAPAEAKEQVEKKPDPWYPKIERAAEPEYRMKPVRSRRPMDLRLSDKTHYFEARVEELGDGVIIFSIETTEAMRKLAAQRQGKPLSAIPLRMRNGMRYDGTKVSASMIRNRIGKDVRFEIRRDSAGNQFITNIVSPER